MFATRADQENVVYQKQTAAAAKPLNQGVKGLAPKTPAKTPFRVTLNDENATIGKGKTGGKGKQGDAFGEEKSGKSNANAFLTPAGPRNRAPLGNKTTNAKATAFQTPAPPTQEKQSAKPSSPRMRRAKIKVHEAEALAVPEGEEEREIEFMPPREVPLPDHPDDWPHDRIYPQFDGGNLAKGWRSAFARNQTVDEDEEPSDFEEKLKSVQQRRAQGGITQPTKSSPAVKRPANLNLTAKHPLTARSMQNISSKDAVSALAGTSRANGTPGFAAPTATSRSRQPSSAVSKKPASAALGNARHSAARVASNSTLGYSKGRAVSSGSRKDATEDHVMSDRIQRNAPGRTALDDLFMTTDYLTSTDETSTGPQSLLLEDNTALTDFQLESLHL